MMKSISSIERSISKIEQRLADQEAQMAELKQMFQTKRTYI